jgi:sulfite reductase (NADPH) flavoprotein alpha-component
MTTEFLLRLHRWIALVLVPLLAVILLSGGLLALEPMLGRGEAGPRAVVDVAALTTLLQRSPVAQQAGEVEVEPDGTAVTLGFGHGAAEVRLAITTGVVLPNPGRGGLFPVLHDLHEGLLLDAKPVVIARQSG